MSRACLCAVRGECSLPRPIPRVNYSAVHLRHFPDRQYWHWVQDPPLDRKLGWETNWYVGRQDAVSWRGQETELPPSTLKHVRSRCHVPGRHVVYLTYDDAIDCEDPGCSKHRDFLDALHWLGVNVTLLAIASRFEASDDKNGTSSDPGHYHLAARKILAEYEARGHIVGSHTHTHVDLGNIPFDEAKANIDKADEILTKFSPLHRRPQHFRPPYMSASDQVVDYLVKTMGYEVWGSINGGGDDWMEWELPWDRRKWFAREAADLVRGRLDDKNYRPNDDTFSTVLCMHDRPHELHFVDVVVREICEACLLCEFRAVHWDCALEVLVPRGDCA